VPDLSQAGRSEQHFAVGAEDEDDGEGGEPRSAEPEFAPPRRSSAMVAAGGDIVIAGQQMQGVQKDPHVS
jgi:hypothetical protein